MTEQPDIQFNREGMDFPTAMRSVAQFFGYDATTITVNGSTIDVRDPSKLEAGHPARDVSPFGKKVLGILQSAGSTYEERNAVYKDNFQIVGRVMEALFPDGAPRLHDATDFNRWHIFELVIVKLTRYVSNWDNPDADSLVDMLPYLAILGAQDDDIREAIRKQQETEKAVLAQHDALRKNVRDAARRAGLHTEDRGPDYDQVDHGGFEDR